MVISRKQLCAVMLCLLLLTYMLFATGSTVAFAASETAYSDVLEDLHKDSNFDESYYPAKSGDYSLQVIQIAESVNRELFVYVYQPSGSKNLKACSINISTTINDKASFYNYKLELLNSNGVFFKYKVKDFTVKTDAARYYVITSIYRPFDSSIDKGADFGNTITEVNYNVSKQYYFATINGLPFCSVVDIETIVVTDKFVGFCRYKDGFNLYVGACDSHFVAFNTDKRMDKLLEADVYYTSQEYSEAWASLAGKSKEFGDKQDNYAYLSYTQKVEHTGSGLFAGTYKWDRIETVEQFIAENDVTQTVYSGAILDVKVANKITEEGLAALRGKKWVLRFAETEYRFNGYQYSWTEHTTMVGDVTILRLKFETDGIVYNLGTIDNKQTGSDKPINEEEVIVEVNERGKWFLAIVAIIILVILIILVKPVAAVVVFILKMVWKIISFPFKMIGKAVKKRKEKNAAEEQSVEIVKPKKERRRKKVKSASELVEELPYINVANPPTLDDEGIDWNSTNWDETDDIPE